MGKSLEYYAGIFVSGLSDSSEGLPPNIEVYGVAYSSKLFLDVKRIVKEMKKKLKGERITIVVSGEDRKHREYYGINISKFLIM